MTDVDMSRGRIAFLYNSGCADYLHMAMLSRIEELEAELESCKKYKQAYAECERIGTLAVRDLEVRLEKAVKALEWVKFGSGPKGDSAYGLVIDTLAELKGKTE